GCVMSLGISSTVWPAIVCRPEGKLTAIGSSSLATRDLKREIDVFEQMAKMAHTRGLQAACWNAVVIRSLTFGDEKRARLSLQAMDDEQLCNPMSEMLRLRIGAPAPRSGVGEI
ncbi:unnamed protein product, partial [Polarella glacialis]